MSETKPDELGALWERTDSQGRRMMSGKINGVDVVCFAVDKRGNEKKPDWRVLKSRPRGERGEQGRDDDIQF